MRELIPLISLLLFLSCGGSESQENHDQLTDRAAEQGPKGIVWDEESQTYSFPPIIADSLPTVYACAPGDTIVYKVIRTGHWYSLVIASEDRAKSLSAHLNQIEEGRPLALTGDTAFFLVTDTTYLLDSISGQYQARAVRSFLN